MISPHGYVMLNLSQDEISSIDEFRKKKNTAVLTIMFTDIEGFTSLTEEKGEEYVHVLHEYHDDILVSIIEENHSGAIIKFIGDAVMAVFSEPTAAVDKALKIQKSLKEFNNGHPDLEDIKVRIGLHMGQTVIENKMQTDLFGRHVNRASRVEGLADGGHIYLSYSVFDSAKSWIMDNDTADYAFHGSYYLKGIEKPEEIYEVYTKGLTRPMPPAKAKKKGSLLSAVKAALVVLSITALVALVVLQRQRSSLTTQQNTVRRHSAEREARHASQVAVDKKNALVYFKKLYAREPFIDLATPLSVEPINGSPDLKKAVTPIKPGKHVVHYAVSRSLRYYAEFTVRKGENIIYLTFTECRLPGIQINFSLTGKETDTIARTREDSYFLYKRDRLDRTEETARLKVQVTGTRTNSDTVSFNVTCALKLNERDVANKTINVESPLKAAETTRVDEEIIYADKLHYYYIRYHYKADVLQFRLDSAFK